MPMTVDELRLKLGDIEPGDSTYAGITADDIPTLQRMTQNEEPWLAARAVFAIGRIGDPRRLAALRTAATSQRTEVRVAVAAVSRNLDPAITDQLLPDLLADTEHGVRKFAIEAVTPASSAAIHSRLQAVGTQDPMPALRSAAQSQMSTIRSARSQP